MTSRTIVHLLRHGEVENPRGILYGRLPGYHLSADGRRMAEAAATALAGRDVVRVVSSPLERARETAAPIAASHGLDVVVDGRLIEAANVFEGLPFGVGDGVLRQPAHWRHLVNPLRPSWGEPYHELAARMLAAVHDARDDAQGHEAVLVSHQLPIWIVRRLVEGRALFHRPDRRQCGLASLTTLCFEGERLVSVGYAEPAGPASRRPVRPGA
ncbi:MAG: histidine phosphatase family protein [Frankiaceae bacterium]